MADSIKINKLEIENVKRIKAVKIEPTKNGLTIVGGNNNQGKTSVLDSIAWALGGDRYKPSNATRDGSTIRLITKWCFPKQNHENGEYRITKPDTDNLQKMLKDCMTKVGFWKDDALVASEITEKFWADQPGIYIRIEEL